MTATTAASDRDVVSKRTNTAERLDAVRERLIASNRSLWLESEQLRADAERLRDQAREIRASAQEFRLTAEDGRMRRQHPVEQLDEREPVRRRDYTRAGVVTKAQRYRRPLRA